MDLQLKGKITFVTGSTAGIGKAIAVSLAAEGVTVIISGRNAEKVEQAIAEIRAQQPEAVLKPAAAGLGTEEGCRKVMEEHPNLDILINNLGIFEPAEFFDIPDEEWFRFFEVNVMSGVRLARGYLQRMLEKYHKSGICQSISANPLERKN
ncbi:MAG: SDR family oxidoreductase [Paenibacillaceae bacterium]|nr:SDR family oxidoreductase [Paenibacillaceae bacterium]